MKRLLPFLFALSLLCCFRVGMLHAQEVKIPMDKLMNTQGITVVYLSPSMLAQSGLKFSSGNGCNASFQGLLQSVHSVYIFSAEESHNISYMRNLFSPMYKVTNQLYEQLFFVKEDNRTMRFICKKNRTEIPELYLLVDAPDEYVAITIQGSFSQKQIEEVAQSTESTSRPLSRTPNR